VPFVVDSGVRFGDLLFYDDALSLRKAVNARRHTTSRRMQATTEPCAVIDDFDGSLREYI
jgi:hypothetical protein